MVNNNNNNNLQIVEVISGIQRRFRTPTINNKTLLISKNFIFLQHNLHNISM